MPDWIIVEDVVDRAEMLANAIHENLSAHGDRVVWLAVAYDLKVEDVSKQAAEMKVEARVCLTINCLVEELNSVPVSAIILLDVKLEGVHSISEVVKGRPLMKALSAMLGSAQTRRIVAVESSQLNQEVVRDAIEADVQNKVCLTSRNLHIDHPERTKEIIESSLEFWNRLYSGPLRRFWIASKDWFLNDAPDCYGSDRLPHNWLAGHRREHQEVVQKTLPWLPGSWWSDDKSVGVLHQTLKSMCGLDYAAGTKNINVGAVWLIAAMAHNELGFPVNPFCPDQAGLWSKNPQSQLNFLPAQDVEAAMECALHLFEFFHKAFGDDKSELGKLNPAVVAAKFRDEGGEIEIELKWSGDILAQKLRDDLLIPLDHPRLSIPSFFNGQSAHTRDPLAAFLVMSNICVEGFGMTGSFRMRENKLQVQGRAEAPISL